MPVLLGLVVALTYGTGDFFGGLSSRRSPAVAVVVRSYGWSLATMALLLAVTRPAAPLAHDLLIGVAVGFIGPIGIVLLYKGLGSGRMSVVAPVTAVGASIVPVAWGLLTGERPSTLRIGRGGGRAGRRRTDLRCSRPSRFARTGDRVDS